MSDAPVPLSGNQKRKQRTAARLYALQALFQMEESGQSVDAVCDEFEEFRFGASYEEGEFSQGDPALFRNLVSDAVTKQAQIDQLTDRALVAKWKIDRIDPTLRALFRAAGAELLRGETPPRAVINEFIDVARAFNDSGKEPKFVNAVLDHMAREVLPEAFENGEN